MEVNGLLRLVEMGLLRKAPSEDNGPPQINNEILGTWDYLFYLVEISKRNPIDFVCYFLIYFFQYKG